jgi:Asp-tRNA(Asn)/Glu-tRNA(Gln) amidotransferase A subunit family amidase
VGIKPTLGRIGSWPPQDWIDLSTFGPFATTVEDLRLLLEVESGPAPGDPVALPAGARVPFPDRPTRLLAAHRTSDLGPLPAGVRGSLEAAVAAFADVVGLPVTWMEPRDFFTDGDPDLDWFTVAAAEHVSALGRARVEESLDRLHPATRVFLAGGLAVDVDAYLAARRRRYGFVRRLDELLAPSTLLLTPTVAVEGWLADGRLAADAAPAALPPEVFSTAVQNVTGHPAITLPAGRSANGLPFGLQVTGPRHADGLLLAVAAAWEAVCPWPLAAPGYEVFGSAAVEGRG